MRLMSTIPRHSLAAGAAYATLGFGAGCLLAAPRTLWLAPRIGALAAVAIETPIMLAIGWFLCRAIITRFAIPPHENARLLMGASAFLLLQSLEILLAALLGIAPGQYLAGWLTLPGLLGLAGQGAFAALPLLVAARPVSPPLSAIVPLPRRNKSARRPRRRA